MQPRSDRWVIPALAVLVVTSAALNLSLALRSGRLAVIPLYDDVVYLHDAYSRLVFEQGATLAGWADSFLSNPPHSPLSTLTAMVGYSLVGPSVVGPYVANIWILGLYTVAIYLVSRRSLGAGQSLLVAVLFLFVPVAHAMFNEFRPDMAAALLMTLSLYLIMTARWEDMGWTSRGMLGLLAAMAVVAKPSAVVMTVPLIGLAVVVSAAQAIHFEGQPRRVLGALVIPLLAFLLVTLPFAIVWGPQIVAYLTQALFTNADIWSTPGDLAFQWTYHSFGEGGRLGLGPFLQGGLFVIAIDAVASLRTSRDRPSVSALSYYAMLLIIYAGMSMHSQKSLFQGSFFYVPFTFGVAMALTRRLGWVTQQVQSARPAAWLLGAAVAAAIIFLPPATLFTNTGPYAGTLAVRDRLVDEVVKRMAERIPEHCPDRQLSFADMSPYPVNSTAVALALAMKSGARIGISGLYFERSAESLFNAAMANDFVLVPGEAHIANVHLPAIVFIDEVAARLKGSGAWSAVEMPSAMGDRSTLLLKVGC